MLAPSRMNRSALLPVLAVLLAAPATLPAQIRGMAVMPAWGYGPILALDYSEIVEEKTNKTSVHVLAFSAGLRSGVWALTGTIASYVPDSGAARPAIGLIGGPRPLALGFGYVPGPNGGHLHGVVGIPALLGIAIVTEKLAFAASAGIYGDVSSPRGGTEWRGGSVLLAQIELPNGFGARLAVDAQGWDEPERWVGSFGLHYSFRPMTSMAPRRRKAPPAGPDPRRAVTTAP